MRQKHEWDGDLEIDRCQILEVKKSKMKKTNQEKKTR